MSRTTTIWTFVITSVALFMATLDNLVVTTSLPVIRADLGASIEDLEWTVNAYTLSFAVFLLTGAALGDRFGRRRLFVIGLGIFTGASVAAALAPSVDALIAARAVQGLGGAIVTPLTLTILSAAVSPEKRGVALGAWGGIGGLAVASGPLIGGAVVEGISWHWIFWLNVPIGLVLMPLAALRLKESYGPSLRPLQSLGYKQLGALLDGACDAARAVADTVAATVAYARRQRTWFRAEAAAARFSTENGLEALDATAALAEDVAWRVAGRVAGRVD